MPVEILRDIFKSLTVLEHWYHPICICMTGTWLSHVSYKWRQITLDIPDFWQLFDVLHPEAVLEYIDRTKNSGLVVHIAEREKIEVDNCGPSRWANLWNKRAESFFTSLGRHFHDIRELTAEVHTRGTLHRILDLGRGASTTRIRNLKILFRFEQYTRVPPAELNDYERQYGSDILDWEMPYIQFLECHNVLPVVPKGISQRTLLVGSRCIMRVPVGSQPHLLTHLTHLTVAFENGWISFTTSDPNTQPPRTILFPHLKRLSTLVRMKGDPKAFHHHSTFNRLRCPALETLIIRLDQEFESSDAVRHINGALSSMSHLRSLEILETNVRLEDFLNANLFPELETCALRWVSVRPRTSRRNRLQGTRMDWFNLPPSLKHVKFTDSRVHDDSKVISKLLRSRHRQLTDSIRCRKLGLVDTEICFYQAADFIAKIREELGEAIAERLKITGGDDQAEEAEHSSRWCEWNLSLTSGLGPRQ